MESSTKEPSPIPAKGHTPYAFRCVLGPSIGLDMELAFAYQARLAFRVGSQFAIPHPSTYMGFRLYAQRAKHFIGSGAFVEAIAHGNNTVSSNATEVRLGFKLDDAYVRGLHSEVTMGVLLNKHNATPTLGLSTGLWIP